MKEATGELNMTVVTVVAIAAVAAFFYAFVWPAIQRSIEQNTRCAAAVNCQCSDDTCDCKWMNDEGTYEDIECPNNDTTGNTQSNG